MTEYKNVNVEYFCVRSASLPPEGLGGVGHHGDTQLDGLADGEGQVLVTVTEVCNTSTMYTLKRRSNDLAYSTDVPIN